MSSSAAAVRMHQHPLSASAAADTFPIVVRGNNRTGSGRQPRDSSPGTAFPFSFPEAAVAADDLSESCSNASDDDERRAIRHSSTRDPPPPARTRSLTRRRTKTHPSDMLEVQPAPASRGVSPSPTGRPRSGVASKMPVSPRKVSVEAAAALDGTVPGSAGVVMDILIRRDSFYHDFGFDISGGCDTGHPLSVSGVLLGGPADVAGLWPDDVVLALDNMKAGKLSHVDTVQIIKTALQIHLKVQRNHARHRPTGRRSSNDGDPSSDSSTNYRGYRGGAAERRAVSMSEQGAGDMTIDSNRQMVPSAHSQASAGVFGKNKHNSHQTRPDDENDAGSAVAGGAGELNNQAYAWIDIGQQPCSPPPEEDTLSIPGASTTANILPERKCVLVVSDDVHLGLLIRGGLEYGLGIYVTGLDKASAAEAANLRIGDQILFVNNCDFRRITHPKAVRMLRTHRHMTLRVRYVGKLPYARRLTPSSLSSSSSIVPTSAQTENLQSLYTNAALLATDPAQDEIDRLTREAMLEQVSPTDEAYLDAVAGTASSSASDLPYDSYMLDLEVDEEVLRLKQKMKEKRELLQERPRAGRIRSSANDYWTNVVERNANKLLKDENETGALMYFLREYANGDLGVDALVLSLFHTMDSLPNFQLLDDIRNLIAPQDISRYDSLMSGMKTEIMSSPLNFTTASSPRPSTNILSPSMLNLDELSFIKPLPPVPLKSAIKATPYTQNQAPTVVDPMSFGPVDIVAQIPNETSGPLLQTVEWPAANLQNGNALALYPQWVQQTPPMPIQIPPVPMAAVRSPLYGPAIITNHYSNAVPQIGLPPIYPRDDRIRFAEFPPGPDQLPEHDPFSGNTGWPNGRKSYSIDCLPQSLLHPDGRNYELRPYEHDNMRRRPSYGQSYSYPKASIHTTYDYSDTPAGMARSQSKVLTDRRQSHFDIDHDRSHQDSDGRPRSGRHRLSPAPLDPPHSGRRRNRSVAGSMDEAYHGLQTAAGKGRKDDHRNRRVSSLIDDTIISDLHPPPIVGQINKSRPQSLQVPIEHTAIANGDAHSPAVIETIIVKKNAPFLGLAIEGGNDTNHALPRIINIQPKGCAHINGQLKVGHCIISVNGTKLANLSHAECVNLITGIFAKKEVSAIEFVVKNTVKPVAT